MDDGYYVENSIEVEEVWKTIELHDPMFGFYLTTNPRPEKNRCAELHNSLATRKLKNEQ